MAPTPASRPPSAPTSIWKAATRNPARPGSASCGRSSACRRLSRRLTRRCSSGRLAALQLARRLVQLLAIVADPGDQRARLLEREAVLHGEPLDLVVLLAGNLAPVRGAALGLVVSHGIVLPPKPANARKDRSVPRRSPPDTGMRRTRAPGRGYRRRDRCAPPSASPRGLSACRRRRGPHVRQSTGPCRRWWRRGIPAALASLPLAGKCRCGQAGSCPRRRNGRHGSGSAGSDSWLHSVSPIAARRRQRSL